MSKIRDEICRAIKASEKTRYRLSQETGIAQSQLSRLIAGEKGVSLDYLERLAAALDLEILIRPKKKLRRKRKKVMTYGERDK